MTTPTASHLDHVNSHGTNGWWHRLRSSLLFQNRFAIITLMILGVGTVALVGGGVALHILVTDIQTIRKEEFGQPQSRIAERYERLLEDLQATERERVLLQDVRPSRQNLVSFVQLLETAAATSGVTQTIDAVPPEEDQYGQPYPSPVLRYQLTLEGPYEGVTRFLASVHAIPHLVRIEEVRISSGDERDVLIGSKAIIRIAVAVRE